GGRAQARRSARPGCELGQDQTRARLERADARAGNRRAERLGLAPCPPRRLSRLISRAIVPFESPQLPRRRQTGHTDRKRRNVCSKTLRLPPVERVASALVHDEPGSGDPREQRVLIGARTESVLRSPQNKRGRPNPAELTREIILEEALERSAPDGSGQFQ